MTETVNPSNSPTRPWWREGMLWLVLGGPIVVVIASIATLIVAVRNPDPVLRTPSVKEAAQSGSAVGESAANADPSNLPALQARNHAATGGK